MDKDNLDDLLTRFLFNEVEETEKEEVEKWLTEDIRNRNYYKVFCRVNLMYKSSFSEDKVKTKYEDFEKRIFPQSKFLLKLWVRVAACLVVFVSLLFVLRNDEKVDDSEFVDEMIESRIMLYLASGDSIVIDNKSSVVDELVLSKRDSVDVTLKKNLFNRLVIPRGAEYELQLSDGTHIWLNAESELSYPSVFDDDIREVHVKGEAYFNVEGDMEKPFMVYINDFVVKVHGTEFNVLARENEDIETVLVEGNVSLFYRDEYVDLKPNQKAQLDARSGKIYVEEVDVLPFVAWKEGLFIFRHESVVSILNKLSVWYDLEFEYNEDELSNIYLSGNMERYEDANKMLRNIELISSVRFEDVGGKIKVIK